MCGGLAIVHMALAIMRERKISSLLADHRHPVDKYGFLAVDEIAARVIATNCSFDRTSVDVNDSCQGGCT